MGFFSDDTMDFFEKNKKKEDDKKSNNVLDFDLSVLDEVEAKNRVVENNEIKREKKKEDEILRKATENGIIEKNDTQTKTKGASKLLGSDQRWSDVEDSEAQEPTPIIPTEKKEMPEDNFESTDRWASTRRNDYSISKEELAEGVNEFAFDKATLEKRNDPEKINKELQELSKDIDKLDSNAGLFDFDEDMKVESIRSYIKERKGELGILQKQFGKTDEIKKSNEMLNNFINKYNERLSKQEDDKSLVSKFLTGGYSMAKPYVNTLINGRDTILAGATAGALTTGATPFLGDEPFGILAGAGAGFKTELAKEMFRTGAGNAYYELKNVGVRDSIAKPIATGMGTIEGIMEQFQLDMATKSGAKMAKQIVEDRIKKHIGTKTFKRIALEYGKNWIGESLEEASQEGATTALAIIGKKIENIYREKEDKELIETGSFKDVPKAMVDGGVQSFYGTWLFPLAGGSMQTANYMINKNQVSKKVDSIEYVTDLVEKDKENLQVEDMESIVRIKDSASKAKKSEIIKNKDKQRLEDIENRTSNVITDIKTKAQETVDQGLELLPESEAEIESELLEIDDMTNYDISNTNDPITQKDLDNYKFADKKGIKNDMLERLEKHESPLAIAKDLKKELPGSKHELSSKLAFVKSIRRVKDEISTKGLLNTYENVTKSKIALNEAKGIDPMEQEIEESENIDQEEQTIEDEQQEIEEPEAEEKPDIEPTQAKNDVQKLNVKDINVEPERFQFRSKINDSGVTKKLEGVDYNPDLAGIIHVWEDDSGDQYVINGHHRLDLAKKSGEEQIVSKIYTHEQFTESEAKGLGAMINIAEGNANRVDVAKLFRNNSITPKELEKFNVKMDSALVKEGIALSDLHDALFNKAITREIAPKRAVMLGEMLEPDAQMEAYKMIKKEEESGKRLTLPIIKSMINTLKSADVVEEEQMTLFGKEKVKKTLAYEKAVIEEYINNKLKSEKRLLNKLDKKQNVKYLEELGNQLDMDTNISQLNQAEQILTAIDKMANYKGTAINELLNKYALALKEGDKQAKQDAYDEIINLYEEGGVFGEGKSEQKSVESSENDKGSESVVEGQIGFEENFQVINPERARQQQTFQEVENIVEQAKENPYLKGVNVKFIDKLNTIKFKTGKEAIENGYPKQYAGQELHITGEQKILEDGRSEILLYKGSSKDTISEEIIHTLQDRLEFIDNELYSDIQTWENTIKEKASNLGYSIPEGKELFAQALVFGELGYSMENEQIANLIAIDDNIVNRFTDILGDDLLEAMMGNRPAQIAKEKRKLKSVDKTLPEALYQNMRAENRNINAEKLKNNIKNTIKTGSGSFLGENNTYKKVLKNNEGRFEITTYDEFGEKNSIIADSLDDASSELFNSGHTYSEEMMKENLKKISDKQVKFMKDEILEKAKEMGLPKEEQELLSLREPVVKQAIYEIIENNLSSQQILSMNARLEEELGSDFDVKYLNVFENLLLNEDIALKDIPIYSRSEMATLLSIFNNSAFETAGVIFIKDNKIINSMIHTNKTYGTVDLPNRQYDVVAEYAKDHEVDEVYFFHNHPSNGVAPSDPDMKSGQTLQKMFGDIRFSDIVIARGVGYEMLHSEIFPMIYDGTNSPHKKFKQTPPDFTDVPSIIRMYKTFKEAGELDFVKEKIAEYNDKTAIGVDEKILERLSEGIKKEDFYDIFKLKTQASMSIGEGVRKKSNLNEFLEDYLFEKDLLNLHEKIAKEQDYNGQMMDILPFDERAYKSSMLGYPSNLEPNINKIDVNPKYAHKLKGDANVLKTATRGDIGDNKARIAYLGKNKLRAIEEIGYENPKNVLGHIKKSHEKYHANRVYIVFPNEEYKTNKFQTDLARNLRKYNLDEIKITVDSKNPLKYMGDYNNRFHNQDTIHSSEFHKATGEQYNLINYATLKTVRRYSTYDDQYHKFFFMENDPLDSPMFKRWFGDSKVVDEQGNPRKMYHGTSARFDVFEINKSKNGKFGKGFYFTPEKDIAERYAYNRSEGTTGFKKVKEVYLRIENPFDVENLRKSQREMLAEYVKAEIDSIELLDKGSTNESAENIKAMNNQNRAKLNTLNMMLEDLNDFENLDNKTKKRLVAKVLDRYDVNLQEKGYDGIKAGYEEVVFEPTQIKSTKGVTGEFSNRNPNINYQLKPVKPESWGADEFFELPEEELDMKLEAWEKYQNDFTSYTEEIFEKDNVFKMKHDQKENNYAIVHENVKDNKYKYQISYFKGEKPVGDFYSSDFAKIINDLFEKGYKDIKNLETMQRNYQIKGIHYGDLGVGKDTTLEEMTYGRSTGHFGTGTYFLSENYSPSESFTNRPVREINLKDFNLLKITDTDKAYTIHDFFRSANRLSKSFSPEYIEKFSNINLAIEEDYSTIFFFKIKQAIQKQEEKMIDKYTDLAMEEYEGEMEFRTFEKENETYKKYNKIVKKHENNIKKLEEFESLLDRLLDARYALPNLVDEQEFYLNTIEAIKEQAEGKGNVTVANRLLSKYGYEGIDVTQTNLDNTTYGSVIFSDKEGNSKFKDYTPGNKDITKEQLYDNFVGKNNFQLKTTKDLPNLYATHNVTLEDLENTLDLGGFPVPSIAVYPDNEVDVAQDFVEAFGDNIITFKGDTIRPELNDENMLFNDDIYTATFPDVVKVKVKQIEAMKEEFNRLKKYDYDGNLKLLYDFYQRNDQAKRYRNYITSIMLKPDMGDYSRFPISLVIDYAMQNVENFEVPDKIKEMQRKGAVRSIENMISQRMPYKDQMVFNDAEQHFTEISGALESFVVKDINPDLTAGDYSSYSKLVKRINEILDGKASPKARIVSKNIPFTSAFSSHSEENYIKDVMIPGMQPIRQHIKEIERMYERFYLKDATYSEIENDEMLNELSGISTDLYTPNNLKMMRGYARYKQLLSIDDGIINDLDIWYKIFEGSSVINKDNKESVVKRAIREKSRVIADEFTNKIFDEKTQIKYNYTDTLSNYRVGYDDYKLENVYRVLKDKQEKIGYGKRYYPNLKDRRDYKNWRMQDIAKRSVTTIDSVEDLKSRIKRLQELEGETHIHHKQIAKNLYTKYDEIKALYDDRLEIENNITNLAKMIDEGKSEYEVIDTIKTYRNWVIKSMEDTLYEYELTSPEYQNQQNKITRVKENYKSIIDSFIRLTNYVGKISESKPLRIIGLEEIDTILFEGDQYDMLSEDHKNILKQNDVKIMNKRITINEIEESFKSNVEPKPFSSKITINSTGKVGGFGRITLDFTDLTSDELTKARQFIKNQINFLELSEDIKLTPIIDSNGGYVEISEVPLNLSKKLEETNTSFQLKIPHNNYTQSEEMDTLSFPETVAKADISPEFKKLLDQKEYNYAVKKNINTYLSALKYLDDTGIELATDQVLDDSNPGTPELFALAQAIIAYNMDQGNTRQAEFITEAVSRKAKNLGQAIQVLSMWGRYTPGRMVRHAKKVINDSLSDKDKKQINDESFMLAQKLNEINAEATNEIDIKSGLQEIVEIDDDEMLLKDIIGKVNKNKNVQNKKQEDLTPQELLARKVVNTTKKKERKPKDPVQIMVDTLFNVAKESPLPEQKKPKDNKLKFIAKAIADRAGYRDVWKKAKKIVEEKLKEEGQESQIESLNKYFEKSINRTFPDNQLSKVIDEKLKDMEVKIREVVKKHYSINSKVRKSLSNRLIKEAGLNGVEAEILEKHIYRQMKDKTKEAKEKELKKRFTKREPSQPKSASQTIIELSNLGGFKNTQYKSLVAEKLGLSSVNNEVLDVIHAQAQYIQTLEPESREWKIEVARMKEMIAKHKKKGTLEKISFAQTLAQLLNFKTSVRNLAGNMGFASIEVLLTDNVKVPLDYAVSKFTGVRTAKFMPGQKAKAWAGGFKEGWDKGLYDSLNHIDTTENTTRFDFKSTRMYHDGIMGKLETALNISLRATDRAFYRASVEEALAEMKTLHGELTDEMIETAHVVGLYRTFQDDSRLADFLVKTKRHLNLGKAFGVGSMVLKYPKTPANLLNRGLEYSPFGAVMTISKLYADTFDNQYLKQKMIVDGVSRALVGTTIMTAGALLYRAGIITRRKDDDKDWDIYSTEIASGLRQYQINKDALKRLINGQDPSYQYGDNLSSYDWFQPTAITIGMGADIEANSGVGGFATNFFKTFNAGVESITSQPLLSNLAEAFQEDTPSKAMTKILQQVPNSFVPTLFSQTQIMFDPTVYNTWVKGDWVKTMVNKASKKVPYLANKIMQPRIESFGDIAKYYDANDKSWLRRFYDSYFSPSITSKYEPTPNEEMVLDIYENSGETMQAPRSVDWEYKIRLNNGKYVEVKLNEREYRVISQWVGKETDTAFEKVRENYYGEYDDEIIAQELSSRMTQIKRKLKEKLYKMYKNKDLSNAELIEGEQ